MKHSGKLFFLLLTVISIAACKPKPKYFTALDSNPKVRPHGAESFDEFYYKFLTDTSFQMSRINFPLEGIPDQLDPLSPSDSAFHWKREGWRYHKAFDPKDPSIQQEFNIYPFYLEEVIHIQKEYCTARRFCLGGDQKWYLIHYTGLNRCAE